MSDYTTPDTDPTPDDIFNMPIDVEGDEATRVAAQGTMGQHVATPPMEVNGFTGKDGRPYITVSGSASANSDGKLRRFRIFASPVARSTDRGPDGATRNWLGLTQAYADAHEKVKATQVGQIKEYLESHSITFRVSPNNTGDEPYINNVRHYKG